MTIRSIGIVGHGAFGTLLETLIRRFAPFTVLRMYSPEELPDGKRFFSLEETCKTDALVLAVPIRAFEEVLIRVLPFLGKETVLVDVATVKLHTADLLRRHASGRPWISSHPMFGPESYEKYQKEVRGFRIAITEHTLPANAYAKLHTALTSAGFSVIELESGEHDRLLAESLFVTHFIAQTVSHAGYRRTPIDTPSFGSLMDAVESVERDEALFRDVYHFNPHCAEVLKRLETAAGTVRDGLNDATKP